MTGPLPVPEHVSRARVETAAPIEAMSLRPRVTLNELSRDYVFYNPGLLFSAGRMTDDPILDYFERSSIPVCDRPTVFESEQPLFDGIGPDWDHKLELVRAHVWPGLRDFLSGIVIRDRESQFFGVVSVRRVVVWDALAKDDRGVVCAGIVVNSNCNSYTFGSYIGGCLPVPVRAGAVDLSSVLPAYRSLTEAELISGGGHV